MKVEIQINQHVEDNDDLVNSGDHFITWAPTFCRARLIDGTENTKVVLTNDLPSRFIFIDSFVAPGDHFEIIVAGESVNVVAPSNSKEELASALVAAIESNPSATFAEISAIANGQTVTLKASEAALLADIELRSSKADGTDAGYHVFELAESGVVNFRHFEAPWPVNTTADQDHLELELPADGSWKPFVIAGRFGHPSYHDQDAVIEARKEDLNGVVLGQAAVMVRVRRNILSLTYRERVRFLDAIAALHFGNSTYSDLVELHTMATMPMSRAWIDQAHDGPGFLPWHRAFLLLFERLLQEQDPGVALHYWQEEGAGDEIFSAEFLGANALVTPFRPVAVDFKSRDPSRMHPLDSWAYGGSPLERWSIMRDVVGFSITLEKNMVKASHYFTDDILNTSFSDELEDNPHNMGHGWVGPWMSDCKESPRDPIFWLFHCDIDRLWARWQHVGDHFGTDGSDRTDYEPVGIRNRLDDHALGHYLDDTMWPWDGIIGVLDPTDLRGNRPTDAPGGPFPAAPIRGLWPAAAEDKVHPADMIGYLGHAAPTMNLGFCYDDSPFSPVGGIGAPPAPAIAAEPQIAESLDMFFDESENFDRRIKVASELDGRPLSEVQATALRELLLDNTKPDQLRSEALRLLKTSTFRRVRADTMSVLEFPDDVSDDLLIDMIKTFWIESMFTNEGMMNMAQTRQALRPLLSHSSEAVRLYVFGLLAATKDKEANRLALQDLADPGGPLLPKQTAIEILSFTPSPENFAAVRPFLFDADIAVRLAAIRILAGDVQSLADLEGLVRNEREPLAVRRAALARGLSVAAGQFVVVALEIAAGEQTDTALRVEAINGLAAHARRFGETLDGAQIEQMTGQLEQLTAGDLALLEASRINALGSLKRISA